MPLDQNTLGPNPYPLSRRLQESRIGFIYRSLGELRAPGIEDVLKIFELQQSQLFDTAQDLGTLGAYISECGIESVSVREAGDTWLINEHAVPHTFFDTDQPQICPQCVRSNAYHRYEWMLRAIPVCTLHDSQLINECGTCNRPLRWRNIANWYCACGENLLELPASKPVDAKEVHVAKFVLGRLDMLPSIDTTLPPFTREMGVDELVRVLTAVGAVEFQTNTAKIVQRTTRGYGNHLKLAARGLRILEDWDLRFAQPLKRSVLEWRPAKPTATRVWDHVLNVGSAKYRDAVGELLVAALDAGRHYCAAKMVELQGAPVKSRSITEAEARTLLDSSEAEFASLLKSSAAHHVRSVGKYGSSRVFLLADIERLKAELDELATFGELSAESGLSRVELRGLLADGELHSQCGFAGRKSAHAVSRSWLSGLVDAIDGGMQRPIGSHPLIGFSTVRRMASDRGFTLTEVLTALQERRLVAASRIEGSGLDQFMFDRDLAQEMLDVMYAERERVWPMRAVARQLGIILNAAYDFAKKGAFGRVSHYQDIGAVVTAAGLTRFRTTFVTCCQLAEARVVAAAAVRSEMANAGVKPSFSYEILSHRYYAYPRDLLPQ